MCFHSFVVVEWFGVERCTCLDGKGNDVDGFLFCFYRQGEGHRLDDDTIVAWSHFNLRF